MNTIKVESGYVGGELELAYLGGITFARLDTIGAPDIAVVIESVMAILENQKSVPPTSYEDGVKVQDVIAEICSDMGYQFENNGVDITTSEISLQNTNIQKIQKLCHDYNLDYAIENKLLSITNKNEPRQGKKIIITPKNGLINYPTSTWWGVSFTCLYSSLIKLHKLIEIKDSVVPMANREWRVIGVRSILEANMPNGQWFTEVNGSYRGDESIESVN